MLKAELTKFANHPVATASIIFLAIVSIIAYLHSMQNVILSFAENNPTAFATLMLALVTVLAIIKDPLSRAFSRPIVRVFPSRISKYPDDIDEEISIFAVQPLKGSSPMHIWVRLCLQNVGRTSAKNVYAKVVSVCKISIIDKREIRKRLSPFNPFKLRWVSLDKIIGFNTSWKNSMIEITSRELTTASDLVPGEIEYLNLCTFVSGFKIDEGNMELVPLLVPGLPEDDGCGNTVGQGHVAGMNREILSITAKTGNENGEQKWTCTESIFRYNVIVGGSNFKTTKCSFIIKCSIKGEVITPTEAGNYSAYVGSENYISVSIEKEKHFPIILGL